METTTPTIKEQVEAIIKKELPKFWLQITERNNIFSSGTYLAIKIAVSDKQINGVQGQYVQMVSLSLDTTSLELKPQIFGGSGGQCIYRKPNKEDAKERFLAMKSVKIPFRTPQPQIDKVLKCIERFCQNYKLTLAENFNELCYQDLVDYDAVLN